MNLQAHPELLDRLAAHHALGTLRGGARRRLEAIARTQPAVRAAVLTWQGRLSSLAELQRAEAPSPVVWTRIENLVHGDMQRAALRAAKERAIAPPARTGWWQHLGLWRGLTFASVALAALAVVGGLQVRERLGTEVAALQGRLQATPQIQYVAVLGGEPAGASVLVTFDARSRQLVLQRVGDFHEGPDKSLQLWALPPSGGPRSLGVLGGDQVLRLPATTADVREVPALAISLEPRGGVPGPGGPTGPVLFKGALIQKIS
ncbi:MAG: polymerase subunit sigma-70 [Rhodoferax sp.]|nr:polymerase subunit sigma-70 [Rhodoferax sp.]